MNDKKEKVDVLDTEYVQLENPDAYFENKNGEIEEETYSKEDAKYDDKTDLSKFYLEYELSDEEIDIFETILKALDIKSKMSVQYYLSILNQIRDNKGEIK